MKPCNATLAQGYPYGVPSDTEIPEWVLGVNFVRPRSFSTLICQLTVPPD
jgi:hypothetical protein